ncbi:TRAP transporter small permease [Sporosarcina sp. P33]|uniref:TRAP transporter small permease n=1 Tax=Sporosarcina sp. P33 TaxID=1930764 RepID=UPI001E35A8C9|nr:TRAP transporter small permease subunit [Sporosarcina sp. P33]
MLSKIIQNLTRIMEWIALIVMALLMFFITIAVISRMIFFPIIGDVEIVQLGMVILIMGSIAYTQRIDGHISIGLIVDKFSPKAQKVMDSISALLKVVITFIIGYIFIGIFLEHKNHIKVTTDLFDIPYYPFDLFISIAFIAWGLEALLKFFNSINDIFQLSHKGKEK